MFFELIRLSEKKSYSIFLLGSKNDIIKRINGVSVQEIKDVQKMSSPISMFVVELLKSLVSTFKLSTLGPKLMPLNDPIAALVAAEPDLVTTEKARVDVELSGNHTYGRTVVDFLFRNGKEANVDVAIHVLFQIV